MKKMALIALCVIFITACKTTGDFLNSPTGQAVTQFTATAIGAASGATIIQKANPSNKAGTAQDVLLLSSAAYTALSGDNPPDKAQMTAIFKSFKSNASTQAYDDEAAQMASGLSSFISQYQGTPWVKAATWYVYGWQLSAEALGGSI